MQSDNPNLNRPPTGLVNLGNTCYMNSALQALTSIDELVFYFYDLEEELIAEIENDLHNEKLVHNLCKSKKTGEINENCSDSQPNFYKLSFCKKPMFDGGNENYVENIAVAKENIELQQDFVREENYLVKDDSLKANLIGKQNNNVCDNVNTNENQQGTIYQKDLDNKFFTPFTIKEQIKYYTLRLLPNTLISTFSLYFLHYFEHKNTYTPSHLKLNIANITHKFADYKQHDSSEFIVHVLNFMHEELIYIKKEVFKKVKGSFKNNLFNMNVDNNIINNNASKESVGKEDKGNIEIDSVNGGNKVENNDRVKFKLLNRLKLKKNEDIKCKNTNDLKVNAVEDISSDFIKKKEEIKNKYMQILSSDCKNDENKNFCYTSSKSKYCTNGNKESEESCEKKIKVESGVKRNCQTENDYKVSNEATRFILDDKLENKKKEMVLDKKNANIFADKKRDNVINNEFCERIKVTDNEVQTEVYKKKSLNKNDLLSSEKEEINKVSCLTNNGINKLLKNENDDTNKSVNFTSENLITNGNIKITYDNIEFDYNTVTTNNLLHKTYITNNSSIISRLFHGQFMSVLGCINCEFVSKVNEPFMSLSLPILKVDDMVTVYFVEFQRLKHNGYKTNEQNNKNIFDRTKEGFMVENETVNRENNGDCNLFNNGKNSDKIYENKTSYVNNKEKFNVTSNNYGEEMEFSSIERNNNINSCKEKDFKKKENLAYFNEDVSMNKISIEKKKLIDSENGTQFFEDKNSYHNIKNYLNQTSITNERKCSNGMFNTKFTTLRFPESIKISCIKQKLMHSTPYTQFLFVKFNGKHREYLNDDFLLTPGKSCFIYPIIPNTNYSWLVLRKKTKFKLWNNYFKMHFLIPEFESNWFCFFEEYLCEFVNFVMPGIEKNVVEIVKGYKKNENGKEVNVIDIKSRNGNDCKRINNVKLHENKVQFDGIKPNGFEKSESLNKMIDSNNDDKCKNKIGNDSIDKNNNIENCYGSEKNCFVDANKDELCFGKNNRTENSCKTYPEKNEIKLKNYYLDLCGSIEDKQNDVYETNKNTNGKNLVYTNLGDNIVKSNENKSDSCKNSNESIIEMVKNNVNSNNNDVLNFIEGVKEQKFNHVDFNIFKCDDKKAIKCTTKEFFTSFKTLNPFLLNSKDISSIYIDVKESAYSTHILDKLLNPPLSIDDCLSAFTKSDILQSTKCNSCQNKKVTKTKLLISNPPKFLIADFKRFSFNGNSAKKKDYVEINEEIKIKNKVYENIAIVNHFGNSYSHGHYTAYVKRGKWYHANDRDIQEEKGSVENAYVVVYKRKDDY